MQTTVQHAPLQIKPRMHFQRFEFKYYLHPLVIPELKKDLLRFMRWDPYVADLESKSYDVVSLYYDSPRFAYYHEKIDGMSRRKKIRWRTYISERGVAPYFCEIKRKFDMVTLKDRLMGTGGSTFQGMHGLPAPDRATESDRRVLDELYVEQMKRRLEPKVLVRYSRSPLIGVYEDRLRITLDSNIRAARTATETMAAERYEPVLTNGAILEVKYNNTLPFWFLAIVRRFGLSRIAYSKYCKSIEHVHRLTRAPMADLLPK